MDYDIRINEYGKKYYINKVLHREGEPAIERYNGDKCWYKNGELHREDGPAVEGTFKAWWLDGKIYGINNDFTNESWKKFIKTLIFS